MRVMTGWHWMKTVCLFVKTDIFMSSNDSAKSLWKWLVAILAAVAAGLSIWLTVQKLNGTITTLAGCGGGSDCANVLGSKWSMVFGLIPVSVLSSLLYLGILASLWMRGVTVSWFRQLAAWIIVGSAVWFTVLQIFVIGSFCKYCMTMHAVGVALALLILVMEYGKKEIFIKRAAVLLPFSVVFVLSLAAVQYFGPEPVSHRVDDITIEAFEGDAHAEGEGRLVMFFEGKKKYRVEALPHVGASDADYVLVKYFDYTCDACWKMHEELDVLLGKYPERLAVILLPVPINRSCNPHLPEGVHNHEGACELAILALRVWRADPEKFASFHAWLFENREVPAEAAEAMAAGLVGQDKFPPADDAWVLEVLQQNVADYKTFSQKTAVMPKLAIKGSAMMQGATGGGTELETELKKYLSLE